MPHTMRAALASAQQRTGQQRQKEGAHPFFSTVGGAAQEKHRLFGFHATDHPVKASERKGNRSENFLFCFGCEAKKNRHQHSDPPKNARKNAANPKKSISFLALETQKTRRAEDGFFFLASRNKATMQRTALPDKRWAIASCSSPTTRPLLFAPQTNAG